MKLELGYGWNALQRDCTCSFWPKSVWNEGQILQLAWDVQGRPKTLWTIHTVARFIRVKSKSSFWNFINSHWRERTGWMIAKKPHNELTPACTITALEQAPWGFGYLRSLSINSSILRINRFTSLPLCMLARLMRMSSFASLNPRRDIELSLVSKTLVRLFYFLFFPEDSFNLDAKSGYFWFDIQRFVNATAHNTELYLNKHRICMGK